MNYKERRQRTAAAMEEKSILILYSGIALHTSADEYQDFEANRQFFYLTGIRRERMALVIDRCTVPATETLLIEPIDPAVERWVGKKMTAEEAKAVSGVERVALITDLPELLDRIMTRELPETVYFDTYRHSAGDLEDYNQVRAKEFSAAYPGIRIRTIYPVIAAMRMKKDAKEIALTRKAVEMAQCGLERVLLQLRPGMMEYQVQAEFEYEIKRLGAERTAFPTIAGSGKNGTMLHYETNQERCEDGTLILLDLGARTEGYNSDITRTYPVNGRFTERQKQIYDIVLKANREVAAMAAPGVTLRQLNDRCKQVLADGLLALGKISKPEEISTYYMHSVSHHLGIDVHDVTVPELAVLEPGMVITDEPGLYLDDEEIGIRIEDDLLITESGCEVLSRDILRTTEEIEAKMNKR